MTARVQVSRPGVARNQEGRGRDEERRGDEGVGRGVCRDERREINVEVAPFSTSSLDIATLVSTRPDPL